MDTNMDMEEAEPTVLRDASHRGTFGLGAPFDMVIVSKHGLLGRSTWPWATHRRPLNAFGVALVLGIPAQLL